MFGRIYEYFLTQFADQKAHDRGEFFTPISLVSLIAHVLEPESSTVLDPACGSGGMFVQSARVVDQHHENPAEKLSVSVSNSRRPEVRPWFGPGSVDPLGKLEQLIVLPVVPGITTARPTQKFVSGERYQEDGQG